MSLKEVGGQGGPEASRHPCRCSEEVWAGGWGLRAGLSGLLKAAREGGVRFLG